MMPPIDKQIVCRQFRRAADSYDSQAAVQQRTADHLLDLLTRHGSRPPHKVLEIGCGTGLLTRRLAERFGEIQELVLNDLVPDFASRLNTAALAPAVTFLPGDIESAALLPCTFDLIISSSALHWLANLDSLLPRLAASLTLGGTLAFSLYGPDNLREIRALAGIGMDYLSLPDIEALVSRCFRLVHSSEERDTLYFANPQDALRHLRQTGVNSLSRTPWNRTHLQHFCNKYRKLFSIGYAVSLTYHPLYIVAHK